MLLLSVSNNAVRVPAELPVELHHTAFTLHNKIHSC